MKNDRIYLSVEGKDSPYLQLYIPDNFLKRQIVRPFILVLPGGGYFFCNPREAEAIALRAAGEGFSAAILYYSTKTDDQFPKQMVELAQAMDLIKKRAKEWSADPERIYLCGFSAGAHLAASLGVFWNKESYLARYNCCPRGIIFCYSVIKSGEFGNKRCFDSLCGDDMDLQRKASLHDKFDISFPPCFIWHTYEDKLAPVENPLIMASALRRAGVPFELHIFQRGPHALSLAEEYTADGPEEINPHVSTWWKLAQEWILEDFKD
ncbi:MAG: alpha/beta hydrolase [Sphaerochaeta sp.]